MGDTITTVLSLSAGLIIAILYTELHTIKHNLNCKHICTICKHKKQCFEDMKGEKR